MIYLNEESLGRGLKKQRVKKESDGCLYAVPQVEGSEERRCTAWWEINTRDTEGD